MITGASIRPNVISVSVGAILEGDELFLCAGETPALGFGAHVCLGQHLARMEMSSLFHKILDRLDHIELAGEPKYTQAVFVGGLKSLPIRYKMK